MFKNTGIQKCLKLLISLSIYTPHCSFQFPIDRFPIPNCRHGKCRHSNWAKPTRERSSQAHGFPWEPY